MAPLVLHLAYVPGGRIRRFNDLGDYSYGVYIYAFPIQQTLALMFPAMTLAAMMASSAVVSVAVAVASWKLIEERALAHKDDCAAATRRLFSLGLAKIGLPFAAERRSRIPLTQECFRAPEIKGLGGESCNIGDSQAGS